MKTYLEREEAAYTAKGSQRRRFVAYLSVYILGHGTTPGRYANTGYLVSGRCGIPDTYFSIPAHARIKGRYVAGYLTYQADESTDYESRLLCCVR